jgi:hypothetical protein
MRRGSGGDASEGTNDGADHGANREPSNGLKNRLRRAATALATAKMAMFMSSSSTLAQDNLIRLPGDDACRLLEHGRCGCGGNRSTRRSFETLTTSTTCSDCA